MIESVKIIKVEAEERGVKALKSELKQLKDALVSAEQGTDKYNAALRRAAEIQHTLSETQENIRLSAADFGQVTQNVTKAVGGMIAGFQAANAVMNLFGADNEEIMKSLQKMQSLMSLTQALPALDSAQKAFKALTTTIANTAGATSKFGKALVGTGIGAFALAIGLLITNFDEISKWLDKVTGQTDIVGKVTDSVIAGTIAGFKGLLQTIQAIGSAIKTYVMTPLNAVQSFVKGFSDTEGNILDKLKAGSEAAAKDFVDNWKDVGNEFKAIGTVASESFYESYSTSQNKRLKEEEEKRKELANKELEEFREKENKKLDIELERLNRSGLSGEEFIKKQIELEQKRLTLIEKGTIAYERQLTKIYNLQKELEQTPITWEDNLKEFEDNRQLQLQILEDNLKSGLILEEEYNERKKELDSAYLSDYTDLLRDILENENLSIEERIALYEKLNKARNFQNETNDDTSSDELSEDSLLEGLSQSILSIGDSLNNVAENDAWGKILGNVSQIIDIFDDLNKNHIVAGSKESYSAYMQIAAAGFQAIGSMMNGLASEQDASTKKGFEQQKKYQIAATTMNMLGGIASAWASAMNPANAWMTIWGQLALGATSSALMLATGIMQIQKIKQQQFSGGGSTPSSSSVAAIQQPIQYTQDVQGASIEGSIQDSRVYVLESDITDTQNKVNVIETEAVF